MIRIRENLWIKETDITFIEVNDVGQMILDGTFIVHPNYVTDACTSLLVDYNEVNGQIERRKHEINTQHDDKE